MQLLDVNVLVYAHREDSIDHRRYREWLFELLDSDELYAMSELALSGFMRVTTNPRIHKPPTPLSGALEFVEAMVERPNCLRIRPGERHWGLFTELCRVAKATGNLVPDAYHAALAIEHGCEFITTDRGFARFPGLRWRHPAELTSSASSWSRSTGIHLFPPTRYSSDRK